MKKLKMLIPILAIVFALAASAFTAKDSSFDNSGTLMQGYIQNDDPSQPCDQVNDLDCNPTSGDLCTYEGKQVYQIKSGTSCFNQLYKN